MYVSTYISHAPCSSFPPPPPDLRIYYPPSTPFPSRVCPSLIYLRLSVSHYLVSIPMSMSDLTPSILLSLPLSLPLLCITHIFLSSCNMTRDLEDSEEAPITATGATPDRIGYAGTPEHFLFFSRFLTFAVAHTDL